jgi:hypothetical protein
MAVLFELFAAIHKAEDKHLYCHEMTSCCREETGVSKKKNRSQADIR